MPQFAYRAKDSSLHVVEGTIEADSEAAAITRLGRQGMFPMTIAESGAASPNAVFRLPSRVSKHTLAYVTRQLADLLGGGLPLLSALSLLSKQTENRGLQRVIDRMATGVRDGRSLSEVLSDHGTIFPPLYISMVRAGEVGGALEQSLVRLAELWEHEAEQASRVKSALAYPAFVLLMAAGMTVFLMAYVIPQAAGSPSRPVSR